MSATSKFSRLFSLRSVQVLNFSFSTSATTLLILPDMAPAAVFSKRSFSSSSHFLCHHSRPAERSHKALCCPSPATRSVRQRLAASFQCYSLLQAVKADAHSPKTLRKAQASWKIAWGQPSEALSWQGCQRWEYKRESCRRIYASGQESTVTSESVSVSNVKTRVLQIHTLGV